jgi:hypothetical protein
VLLAAKILNLSLPPHLGQDADHSARPSRRASAACLGKREYNATGKSAMSFS